MSVLIGAISAEVLKLRRTLALWMCVIAPAVVVGLLVLQITFQEGRSKPVEAIAAWQQFSGGVIALWLFLMLPLFVTLQSALLAGLEHGNKQWKHLLALPVPRRVHYLAKWLILIAMVLAAFVVVFLLIPLGGWVLMLVRPDFGLHGQPPWAMLSQLLASGFAATLLMVALQLWVALRWSSFTVAVAIGMSATVGGYLIGQSAQFGHLYPWSMPMQVLAGEGEHLQFVVLAGLIGGTLATGFGLMDFLRREVA